MLTLKSPQKKTKKWLFGEDQSRYVVVVREKNCIEKVAKDAGVFIESIGSVKGKGLKIEKLFEISNKELINMNRKFLWIVLVKCPCLRKILSN